MHVLIRICCIGPNILCLRNLTNVVCAWDNDSNYMFALVTVTVRNLATVKEFLMEVSNQAANDSDDSYEEVDADNNSQQVVCIFSGKLYASPLEYFMELKYKRGFDIWEVTRCDLCLDFFGYVKLINYLRTHYYGKSPPSAVELEESKHEWQKEQYLKPAITDDPLLQFMIDDDDSDLDVEIQGDENDIVYIRQKLEKAEHANAKLSSRLQQATDQIKQMKSFMQDIVLTGDVGIYRPVAACRQGNSDFVDEEYEDSGYFGTYAHHDIHAEMLQDTVRTNAYRDVIMNNKDAFHDKVVLDVGCGTGILSMFAAQAGARHVYGIDMSEIAFQAMDIVKENGLDDKITILKGRVEEIELPVSKVDIIISEWMGYFLLYESMLDSVLFARDKWLSPVGEIYPNYCSVSFVPIHDERLSSANVRFWDDVYGFKMSSLRKQVLTEAAIQVVNESAVLADPVVVHTIDLRKVKGNDLNYKSSFDLKMSKSSPFSAVLGYFDIYQRHEEKSQLMFSTSPACKATHWKQAVFFLDETKCVNAGDVVKGHIDCHKNAQDPRSLVVNISINGETKMYKIE